MTRLALTFLVGVFLFVAGGTGDAWAELEISFKSDLPPCSSDMSFRTNCVGTQIIAAG